MFFPAPVMKTLNVGHKRASVVQRQGRVPGAEGADGRMPLNQGASLGWLPDVSKGQP